MFLVIGLLVGLACGSSLQNPRGKRIVQGDVLYSPFDYNTFHFILFVDVWSCMSQEVNHPLNDCINRPQCGGALITPDFVMTAAHCFMYREIAVKYANETNAEENDELEEYVLTSVEGGELLVETFDFVKLQWNKLKELLVNLFVIPKPKHVVYSNIAMLAGSTNLFHMNQKRHAWKVFPDFRYPRDRKQPNASGHIVPMNDLPWFFRYRWHDVALIQACEPFEITQTVRIAAMKPFKEMVTQFEDLVQRQAVCMYAGFGAQEEDDNWAKSRENATGPPVIRIPTGWMLYTWRYTTCSRSCTWNYLRKAIKKLEPDPETATLSHECKMCSQPHGPRFGTVAPGDSGSPVICNGYFVAVVNEAADGRNYSYNLNYPVHCARDKITKERIAYYKSIGAEDVYHPLRR